MKKFFHQNSLSLVLFLIFVLCWIGQCFTGYASYNDDLRMHGQSEITYSQYFNSGHFIESTFENWESEFLQMALYVVLTACLYQKGSSESNPLPEENKPEPYYPKRYFKNSPMLRWLYERSLTLALTFLFLISFVGHLFGGWKEGNLERAIAPAHLPPITFWEFTFSSEFWFQSFQNWQSEFLSVGMIVLLSVYLRQKGSAQSKPVDMPHHQTEA